MGVCMGKPQQAQQIERLETEQLFFQITDGGQTMNAQQVRALLAQLEITMPDNDVQRLLTLATQQSAQVSTLGLTDFQQLLFIMINSNISDLQHQVFLATDRDQNGTVSCQEMEAMLQNMGKTLSKAQIQDIFYKYASDKELTYEAYVDAMREFMAL